jgi:CxxC-x17-CxxC domain-containing protein
MADFNSRGPKRFGAKASFGGAHGGKPAFQKKSWGGSDRSDRPTTLHKANCSNCNSECEVPFRPVNGKPVFCRNCFVKTGDTAGGRAGDRFQKREFAPRAFPASRPDNNDAVAKMLQQLNTKLDHLIVAIEGLTKQQKSDGLKDAVESATKKPAKRPTKRERATE